MNSSHVLNRQFAQNVQNCKKKPSYTFGTCQIPTLGLCFQKPPTNYEEQAYLKLEAEKTVLESKVQ